MPPQRAAAVPATGSAMRGVLSLLGYCPRVAGGGGPVAVCVRLRDGRRRAWSGACGGARGRGGAAPVLVDVVTPEAVRLRRGEAEVAARRAAASSRVHLHYFCGAVPGENATAGGCAVPAEELVSLLRVALAYALPHASPAAFATPLEKLDQRTHLKWEGCCAAAAGGRRGGRGGG